MQLLTLIPNRCCHFCLATASDYSTGECHKNPLSSFSPAQHKEQTADEMWYEGFQEHRVFFFCHSLPVPPCGLRLLTILTASVDQQRRHTNSTGVELLSVIFLVCFLLSSFDISHLSVSHMEETILKGSIYEEWHWREGYRCLNMYLNYMKITLRGFKFHENTIKMRYLDLHRGMISNHDSFHLCRKPFI